MSTSSQASSVYDRPNDNFIPDFGDYFVYELDPLAAVAHLPKDDPAHAAAASLAKTCKRYVAYLHDKHGLPFPEPKHTNTIVIVPLRQGLPPSRDTLTDPNMCVPVLPNTSHPLYRPLAPVPPLPWADCYHAFFPYNIEVRATTTSRPYNMAHGLSFAERRYYRAIRNEEILKLRKIHEKLPVEVTGPVLPTLLIEAFPETDANDTTGEHPSDSTVPLSQPEVDHAEGDIDTPSAIGDDDDTAGQIPDDLDMLTDIMALAGGFVDASLPVINLSYDLSTVAHVEDPNDFLTEYGEMTRILGEAHERILASRAAQSHPGSPRPRTPINAPHPVGTKPSIWARIRSSFGRLVRQAQRVLCRPTYADHPM